MINNTVKTAPSRIYVDPTHDGNIMIAAIDDNLGDSTIYLTPENAAKLGQILIDKAGQVKRP